MNEEVRPSGDAMNFQAKINGIDVRFPDGRKPFPAQLAVISKVIAALKTDQNALLESPTGTGKTLAFLTSTLSWQKPFRDAREAFFERRMFGEAPTEMMMVETDSEADAGSHVNMHREATQQPHCKDKFQNGCLSESVCNTKCRESNATVCGCSSSTEEPSAKGPKTSKGGRKCKNDCNETPPSVPRIFFCTRTHSQLHQIVSELRNVHHTYTTDLQMTILGSKRHSCINDSALEAVHTQQEKQKTGRLRKGEKRASIDEACAEMMKTMACPFSRKKGVLGLAEELGQVGIWDIEDAAQKGRKIKGCPYFASRELLSHAHLILAPYNYLIDPGVRSAMQINLSRSRDVIVFDEAHNIEDVCREAASVDLTRRTLAECIDQLRKPALRIGSLPHRSLLELLQGVARWMDDLLDASLLPLPLSTPASTLTVREAKDGSAPGPPSYSGSSQQALSSYPPSAVYPPSTPYPPSRSALLLSSNLHLSGATLIAASTATRTQAPKHGLGTTATPPSMGIAQAMDTNFIGARACAPRAADTKAGPAAGRGPERRLGQGQAKRYAGGKFGRYVWDGAEALGMFAEQFQLTEDTLAVYQEHFKTLMQQEEDMEMVMGQMLLEDAPLSPSISHSHPQSHSHSLSNLNLAYEATPGAASEQQQQPQAGNMQRHAEGSQQLGNTQAGSGDSQLRLSNLVITVLRGLLQTLHFLFEHHQRDAKDFRVLLHSPTSGSDSIGGRAAASAAGAFRKRRMNGQNRGFGSAQQKEEDVLDPENLTLSIWCLNAAVVFRTVEENCRSVLLTSGTLAPLDPFAGELSATFNVRVEASHVIDLKKQVLVGVVSTCADVSLNAAYTNQDNVAYQDALGQGVLAVCRSTPGGVLLFLPSYGLMNKLYKRWSESGLLDALEQRQRRRPLEQGHVRGKGGMQYGKGGYPQQVGGQRETSSSREKAVKKKRRIAARKSVERDNTDTEVLFNEQVRKGDEDLVEEGSEEEAPVGESGSRVFLEPRETKEMNEMLVEFYATIDGCTVSSSIPAIPLDVNVKRNRRVGSGGRGRGRGKENAKTGDGNKSESDSNLVSNISVNNASRGSGEGKKRGGRALLMAVCRGKVSEGINFSDNYARAVIIVGIPYPSLMDSKVQLKRDYQSEKHKAQIAEIQSMRSQLCSQQPARPSVKQPRPSGPNSGQNENESSLHVLKGGSFFPARGVAMPPPSSLSRAHSSSSISSSTIESITSTTLNRVTTLSSTPSAMQCTGGADAIHVEIEATADYTRDENNDNAQVSDQKMFISCNGDEWYRQQAFRAVNQAVGRCIRHRSDYGIILLFDPRFLEQKQAHHHKNKLQLQLQHQRQQQQLRCQISSGTQYNSQYTQPAVSQQQAWQSRGQQERSSMTSSQQMGMHAAALESAPMSGLLPAFSPKPMINTQSLAFTPAATGNIGQMGRITSISRKFSNSDHSANATVPSIVPTDLSKWVRSEARHFERLEDCLLAVRSFFLRLQPPQEEPAISASAPAISDKLPSPSAYDIQSEKSNGNVGNTKLAGGGVRTSAGAVQLRMTQMFSRTSCSNTAYRTIASRPTGSVSSGTSSVGGKKSRSGAAVQGELSGDKAKGTRRRRTVPKSDFAISVTEGRSISACSTSLATTSTCSSGSSSRSGSHFSDGRSSDSISGAENRRHTSSKDIIDMTGTENTLSYSLDDRGELDDGGGKQLEGRERDGATVGGVFVGVPAGVLAGSNAGRKEVTVTEIRGIERGIVDRDDGVVSEGTNRGAEMQHMNWFGNEGVYKSVFSDLDESSSETEGSNSDDDSGEGQVPRNKGEKEHAQMENEPNYDEESSALGHGNVINCRIEESGGTEEREGVGGRAGCGEKRGAEEEESAGDLNSSTDIDIERDRCGKGPGEIVQHSAGSMAGRQRDPNPQLSALREKLRLKVIQNTLAHSTSVLTSATIATSNYAHVRTQHAPVPPAHDVELRKW